MSLDMASFLSSSTNSDCTSFLVLLQEIIVDLVAYILQFLSYSSGSQKFTMGFIGIKSRCSRAVLLSGGSRKGSLFLPLPASRGSWHSSACGHILSSKPTMTSQGFLMLHHSNTDSSAFLLHIKDLYGYTGPMWVIQGILSIIRSAEQQA